MDEGRAFGRAMERLAGQLRAAIEANATFDAKRAAALAASKES